MFSLQATLYTSRRESHESDPPELREGFKEFLCALPLEDNNAVWNLCCQLCTAYEHKAFLDGLQYGARLINQLIVSTSN